MASIRSKRLIEAHLHRREVARGRLVERATGGQFGRHIYSQALVQIGKLVADAETQEAIDELSRSTYEEIVTHKLRLAAIKAEVEADPEMNLEDKQVLLAEAYRVRDKIKAATEIMETIASGYE